mgnify:CR=1 FL=1
MLRRNSDARAPVRTDLALALSIALAVLSAGCGPGTGSGASARPPAADGWRRDILATVFWVGEPGNEAGAWDPRWVRSFGGVDDPKRRRGFLPAGFIPKQTPFYCALPYNDVAGRPGAKSGLAGRWVEVRAGGREGRAARSCFCVLADVGPWRVDDREYVLDGKRPKAEAEGRAGIDLSPAVRDWLGLSGKDLVDWRFAEEVSVVEGPWRTWGR